MRTSERTAGERAGEPPGPTRTAPGMHRGKCALAALTLLSGLATGVAGQPDSSEISVVIEQPATLTQGSHATLRVEVRTTGSIARPLLLTPHVEGRPVEMVRGRLLRTDARDPDASTLIFELPIRVLTPGTAVVHVEVAAYTCARRCRLVRVRAKRVLNVSLKAQLPNGRAQHFAQGKVPTFRQSSCWDDADRHVLRETSLAQWAHSG